MPRRTIPKLAGLAMDERLPEGEYDGRLAAVQTRFKQIQQAYLDTGDRAVVVFEGWDAAGKGGAIRRMASVMDPRGFKVWPISAPKPHELEHHYMARFWARLPARGEIAVFDRSWYGRVLVERVEGFASPDEWSRAYREIDDFEQTLTDAGTRIAKLFLAITRDEQFRRFEKRMQDPLKRWKLSTEDFRNRRRWDDYEAAADEMLEKTDTGNAPWRLIPANDKKYARIAALTEIADRLSEGVDLTPRPISEDVVEQYRRMTESEAKRG